MAVALKIEMKVPCVAVVGSTGTGKSGLAMAIAPCLRGEIVNADALQVYRGLDLGTSKPSLGDRRLVSHHLIDIVAPEERFSAGEFARRATVAMEGIRAREALPIVVGGSGLYYRALFEGLSAIPAIAKEVRQALEERLTKEGLAVLFAELRVVDEATALRLSPNDRQRVLRALEVVNGTGRTLSWWRDRKRKRARQSTLRVGLTLPREVLYDRLASRAHRMLESGWLEEVQGLLSLGIPETAPAFQAIGYRELTSHLRGECSLEAAMEDIIRATRRYAKRQRTWFRNEAGIRWFDAVREGTLLTEVLSYLDSKGLRGSP